MGKTMVAKQTDLDKFIIRMPEGMRAQLAKRAKTNGRSMNSEVVEILARALESELSPKEVDLSINELHQAVDHLQSELHRIAQITGIPGYED